MKTKEQLVVKAIAKTISALLDTGARKASLYVNPRFVINVSRHWYKRGRNDLRDPKLSVRFGLPNYVNRKFIKACKKAGEPFPVKKVQLKFARPK